MKRNQSAATMLTVILLMLLLSLLLGYGCLPKDPEPILGVYRRPDKWFCVKYFAVRVILYLRKVKSGSCCSREKVGWGFGYRTHASIAEMDAIQPLSNSPMAFDAVFFIAVTQDGFYLAAGSERRHHGVCNGLLYVTTPGGEELLCSPKLPDTVLFGMGTDSWGAEGLEMRPSGVDQWTVHYSGNMRLKSDPSQQLEVNMEAVWRPKHAIFNYDTDLPHSSIAAAIAREPWTSQYFHMLRKAHQSHYEQMGYMDLKLKIGDKEPIRMTDLPSFRDHSYGQERDWSLMHRYAFYTIFLEDSTQAAVAVICQPSNCSILQTGCMCLPNGKIEPVTWCDLELYQHGECGTPPVDHAFQFQAGGKLYTVQVMVEQEAEHFVGWQWQARMVERFVKYMVNGMPGRGVSEFMYRNKGGRPEVVAVYDPEWFRAFTS